MIYRLVKLIYHLNKVACHHFFVEIIDKLRYALFLSKEYISLLETVNDPHRMICHLVR